MFLRSYQAHHIRHIWFFFCVLLLTTFLAMTAHAQVGGIDSDPGDPGTGGKNTIQGTIYYPTGRRFERRVNVKLVGLGNGEMSTLTDDNGSFTFRRLAAGSYTVTLDAGKEYEIVNEKADIFESPSRRGNPFGQNVTLQIQLRLKPTDENKSGVINAAIADVPKRALELYRKAITLARAGDSRKAVDQLKAALSIAPTFVLALNEMSALYLKLGELDKAGEALAEALKFEPENATLRLNYGYVLMLRQRFVDSERELHRAVQLRDNSTLAHLYRGKVLIKLGNLDEAEKELNRAIILGGNSGVVAYRYLGALYSERGEKAKAIEALEKYLKLTPNAKDAEQVQAIIKELREPSTSTKN